MPSQDNTAGTTAGDGSFGTLAWSNTNNAISVDATYAQAGGTGSGFTQYIKLTNFSFTVPGSATITGIQVKITKQKDGANTVKDQRLRLVKGGTIQAAADKADTVSDWPAGDTEFSYGNSTDMWSNTWTASDVNASNFGVVFAANIGGGLPGDLAKVDQIRIIVFYDAAPDAPMINVPARKRRKRPKPWRRSKARKLHPDALAQPAPPGFGPPLLHVPVARPIYHK